MSAVDVTVWPTEDSVPAGHVNPKSKEDGTPFAVVYLDRQHGQARIQFLSTVSAADQAKYLRALAKVATGVADELDPPTEVPA